MYSARYMVFMHIHFLPNKNTYSFMLNIFAMSFNVRTGDSHKALNFALYFWDTVSSIFLSASLESCWGMNCVSAKIIHTLSYHSNTIFTCIFNVNTTIALHMHRCSIKCCIAILFITIGFRTNARINFYTFAQLPLIQSKVLGISPCALDTIILAASKAISSSAK